MAPPQGTGDSPSPQTAAVLLHDVARSSRSAAGVVQLYGNIYALGGHNGLSIFESVEVYDPATNEWVETVSGLIHTGRAVWSRNSSCRNNTKPHPQPNVLAIRCVSVHVRLSSFSGGNAQQEVQTRRGHARRQDLRMRRLRRQLLPSLSGMLRSRRQHVSSKPNGIAFH